LQLSASSDLTHEEEKAVARKRSTRKASDSSDANDQAVTIDQSVSTDDEREATPPELPETLGSDPTSRQADGQPPSDADTYPIIDPASSADEAEFRHAERSVRRVKTVVHFKESAEESWREMVEVATVSKNGAGLMLTRPCPVGRIVSLVMEMPNDLRLYDHFAEVYPIAGLVQNCVEVMEGETLCYHVGVAFLGKQLPQSYRQDPCTFYRIVGVEPNGLWRVKEAPTGFQGRQHFRFWTPLVMSGTYRDESEKKVERVALQTRDISRGGMAIWGPLRTAVGERVKVSNKEYDFFSMATVRNRTDHPADDSKSLIHVQFEQEFPIEQVRGEDGDAEKNDKDR
jgi:hypothetical protein